jgi:hypothetical protein
MKMRFFTALIILMLSALPLFAVDSDISRLEEAISQRDQYMKQKEARVDSLYRLVAHDRSKKSRLDIYDKLFREYLTFNYDSAMLYVERAETLVDNTDSYDVRSEIAIHKALSLATSGHFSNAIDILDDIESRRLSRSLQEEYFSACEWSYGVWAEYSDKRTISPALTGKSVAYLDSLIAVTDKTTPEYKYRLAEMALRKGDYKDAEKGYIATLKRIPVECRLYAQAAYALALTYKGLGDKENYRLWLINAAISDQKVPLKENLALQQLAMFLNDEEGDLNRANRYLKLALDDAIFYNNRLRMLEIAEKMPDIVNVYQDTISNQNRRLKVLVLIVGLLVIILGLVAILIYRQRQAVSRAKDALAALNEKLHQLNEQLNQTNRLREQYVSLFMDLCATYIDKLNRFPIFLKLKVKKMDDLASVSERYVRPTEAETREMFRNFDTAFLRLYPDFIREFNALLKPDKQIMPKNGELLNTDLRIYALVRMGISDSNKIATLLFLSPQTIFNHRTRVRNSALDRSTFEAAATTVCP